MATRKKKRGKGKVSESTASAERHKKVMAAHPAGSGERFKSLKKELARKGAKNPKALSAWIGAKKYGRKGMTEMAKTGKKRKSKTKA